MQTLKLIYLSKPIRLDHLHKSNNLNIITGMYLCQLHYMCVFYTNGYIFLDNIQSATCAKYPSSLPFIPKSVKEHRWLSGMSLERTGHWRRICPRYHRTAGRGLDRWAATATIKQLVHVLTIHRTLWILSNVNSTLVRCPRGKHSEE